MALPSGIGSNTATTIRKPFHTATDRYVNKVTTCTSSCTSTSTTTTATHNNYSSTSPSPSPSSSASPFPSPAHSPFQSPSQSPSPSPSPFPSPPPSRASSNSLSNLSSLRLAGPRLVRRRGRGSLVRSRAFVWTKRELDRLDALSMQPRSQLTPDVVDVYLSGNRHPSASPSSSSLLCSRGRKNNVTAKRRIRRVDSCVKSKVGEFLPHPFSIKTLSSSSSTASDATIAEEATIPPAQSYLAWSSGQQTSSTRQRMHTTDDVQMLTSPTIRRGKLDVRSELDLKSEGQAACSSCQSRKSF